MNVHDLSDEALARMLPVDLSTVSAPPESPIGEFAFNDATGGIGCFVGQPPWECHIDGDELLHVLAGETRLTILEEDGERSATLTAGSVVVVPRGCWHRNSAPGGATMLYVTPDTGNVHSWAEGDPREAD